MVDKTVRMNLLYDFYGPLLTERQRRFFEMYYADDLSLGEIAEGSGVSRQAVYDIVKRSASALESFERRLGLWERHQQRQRRLGELEQAVVELMRQVERLDNLPEEKRESLLALGQKIATIAQSLDAAEE